MYLFLFFFKLKAFVCNIYFIRKVKSKPTFFFQNPIDLLVHAAKTQTSIVKNTKVTSYRRKSQHSISHNTMRHIGVRKIDAIFFFFFFF